MNEHNKRLMREIILFAIAFIPLLYVVISYGKLPESIPTHWNTAGDVDGWTPKGMLYLLMMSVPVFFNILLLFVPKLDAGRAEAIMKSSIYYLIRATLVGVLDIVLAVSTYAALGHDIPMSTIISLVMGIMFLMVAYYLPRIPYNYFVGFRNPWTLYSKEIWKKTHSFAGTAFFLVGVYMLLSKQIFTKENVISQSMWIICMLLCCFAPIFYSMYLYQKEVNGGKKKQKKK
ncbi:MAG: DUF1648 domain-containing protein [Peptococcaceae bacterium]|jgi:uncharacterized membrane protein|nr:DUF1648 domain-containing protein [Peptococcaceae bacterium]